MGWQLATNTLERVAPLTHAVGNVLKRVFVIGFSIIIFGNLYIYIIVFYNLTYYFFIINFIIYNWWFFVGNKISTQTAIGTSIAIAGVAIYSVVKAKIEEEKRVMILNFQHIFFLPIYTTIFLIITFFFFTNLYNLYEIWFDIILY